MPRLEAYEQQVTAQPVQGGEVPIESFTGGWKTATETFKTLDETVKQFKKVRDFNQDADATLGLTNDIGQIMSEADADQDPSNADKYRQRIDEAIAKNSEKISDPLLRNEKVANMQLSGYKAFSEIRNDFRNKEIRQGQGKFMVLADTLTRSYADASDDSKRKLLRSEYNRALESAGDSGLFYADDIAKMRIKQDKDFDEADLAYDIEHIPDQVENRRKAGRYSTLTDAEFAFGVEKARSMSEKIKKQNELYIKEAQIDNEVKLMSSAVMGQQTSIADVTKMVSSGEIRQDVGIAYIDFLSSPRRVDAATDGTAFVTVLDSVFKTKNKDEVARVIKDTLKGGTDGKFNEDDLNTLIAVANSKNEVLLSVDKSTQKKNSIWGFVEKVNESMREWSKKAKIPDSVDTEMMSTFATDLMSAKTEDDVNAARDKALLRAKQLSNPRFTQFPLKSTVTKNGRHYIVTGHDFDGEPLVELVK